MPGSSPRLDQLRSSSRAAVRANAWAIIAGLTCAALLSGCENHTTRHAYDRHAAIVLTEFRITPDTIYAPPGRLVLIVRNRGRLPHRFAVGRGRNSIGAPPVLAPGARHVMRLDLPRGRYRMFDALSTYDTLGMYGRVIVK